MRPHPTNSNTTGARPSGRITVGRIALSGRNEAIQSRNALKAALRWTRILSIALVVFLFPNSLLARDYKFDGKISEAVLQNYLSRSMTLMYLLTSHGDIDEHIRMMTNCGVKFAGRAVYQWGREEGGESAIPKKLEGAKRNADKIHAADPEIILQACVFEIVSRDVANLPIPSWVFEDLGKPVEQRNFNYDAIIYASGRRATQWGANAGVPDVSRPETKLWFYFLARSYIDAGCEAIHWGQAELMNGNDPNLDHWTEILTSARKYAAKNARRHFLLCDAHVPHHGLVRDGKLLLDAHSFPLRIEEIPDKPKQARLRVGYTDAIYTKSKGGIAPSGWTTEHLPYLVEFDNYGRGPSPGQPNQGGFWIWGWDEITWFAQNTKDDRDAWLRYAYKWLKENDAAGCLEMPGFRILSAMPNGNRWYDVNDKSQTAPNGYSQEAVIKELWSTK
jgi:hypothetical protein